MNDIMLNVWRKVLRKWAKRDIHVNLTVNELGEIVNALARQLEEYQERLRYHRQGTLVGEFFRRNNTVTLRLQKRLGMLRKNKQSVARKRATVGHSSLRSSISEKLADRIRRGHHR